MSSKSSLSYGPDFYLYTDLFDEGKVFLELSNAEFEATRNRVTVAIPLPVWETIRLKSPGSLELADSTDEEIATMVQEWVAQRVMDYAESRIGGKLKPITGLSVYGAPDLPAEDQIASGIAHYTKLRASQRKLREAIKEIQALGESEETAGPAA